MALYCLRGFVWIVDTVVTFRMNVVDIGSNDEALLDALIAHVSIIDKGDFRPKHQPFVGKCRIMREKQ